MLEYLISMDLVQKDFARLPSPRKKTSESANQSIAPECHRGPPASTLRIDHIA